MDKEQIEEEYDIFMDRYRAEFEHEERLIAELLKCRERMGQYGWRATECAFKLKELGKEMRDEA